MFSFSDLDENSFVSWHFSIYNLKKKIRRKKNLKKKILLQFVCLFVFDEHCEVAVEGFERILFMFPNLWSVPPRFCTLNLGFCTEVSMHAPMHLDFSHIQWSPVIAVIRAWREIQSATYRWSICTAVYLIAVQQNDYLAELRSSLTTEV